MTKKIKYLLGILATIVIGTLLYMKFCCCNCNSKPCEHEGIARKNDSLGAKAKTLTNGFSVSDTDFSYNTSDNFRFLNGGYKAITPIPDSLNLGIDGIKNFLTKSKKNFKITGYSLSTEKNTSIYENLGVARAIDLKNYFVSKGIPADRISTFGEINDQVTIVSDTLVGPGKFEFFEIEAASTENKIDYDALRKKINANPLILYFKTGEISINLSEEEIKKVSDMLNYIENVNGSKLVVTGHTDNVGKRDTNIKLGLDRANFATTYLVNNGVSKDKIETTSKGPDEPIADNATPEGKNKNRRTVISIK